MVLFKGDTSGLDKAAGESKGILDGLSSSLGGVGKAAAVGLGAIGVAGIAAGSALVGVGMTFDDAMDGLRTKTGATGADLDKLGESMKGIATGVPNSIGEVSSVMGELSARTGQSGEDLEKLTTQVLQMANATGGDAQKSVEGLTRMLGDASVPAEKQAAALDMVFKASQSTGVGIDRLSGLMVAFGAPMRNLGMTMEESAALLGRFEKEGVNTELVMGALKSASAKWAAEGMAPAEGLKATIAKIQELGPSADATALAMETFGKKAGGDMVDTILGGKFAIDDLVSSIAGSSETVAKAAKDTEGFGEKWAMAKNKIMVAVEPMGTALLGVGTSIMDKLLPAVDAIGYAFSDFQDGDIVAVLNDLGLSMDQASKFGEPFQAIFDNIKGSLSTASEYGMGFADTLALILENLGFEDAGLAVSDLSNAIAGIDWAGIGQSVMTFAGYFKDGLMVVLPIVAAIFKDVLWPVLQSVFGFFKEHTGVLAAVGLLLLALTGPIGLVVAAFTVLGALGPKIGEWVTAIGTGLVGGIGALVGGVVDAVTAVVDAIIDTFKSLLGIASPSQVFTDFGINLLEGLVAGVLSMIATVVSTFGSLGEAVFAAWEAIKVGVMATVEMIRVMISAKWDAIGEYLSAKLDSIKKVISDAFDAARAVIETMAAKYLSIVTEAWSNIFGAIDTALGKVRAVVDTVLSFVEEKTGISMGAMRTVVSDVIGAVQGFFDGMKLTVSEVIGAVAALLTGDFSGALDGMKRAASAGLSAVMGLFSGLGRAIGDAIGDAKDMLLRVGGDIVEGLKAGISKAWDALIKWIGGLADALPAPIKKALGIASPSRVMRDEVGQPIAMGIVEGIRMALDANPIAGIVAGWATKQGPGFVAKLITPMIGAALGAAIILSVGRSHGGGSLRGHGGGLIGGALGGSGGGLPGEIIGGGGSGLPGRGRGGGLASGMREAWGVNAKVANGRDGLMKGAGITDKPSDDRVRADAFRSGRGGLLAASSSNYWQVFVQRFGVPTEASARKVSKQLGIPLPKWLEDIFHPPKGETVDSPDALKEPAQAAEVAFKDLTATVKESEAAFNKIPPAVALLVDQLKNLHPGSDPIVRPLPETPPWRGIGIPIPGPGGSVAFGGGGSAGIPDVAVNAQNVTLRGPLNIGMTANLQLSSGRSLTAELVSALVVDTPALDKLIEAEDRRRAQKS